jgi:hypothetical protein
MFSRIIFKKFAERIYFMPNLMLVKDFIFGDISITGLTYNGEPVFIANQIARILGYKSPQDTVKRYCNKKFTVKYKDLLIDGEIEKMSNLEYLTKEYGITLIKEFPYLKSRMPCLWSRSYFCESVGHISEDTVKRYIDEQKTKDSRKKADKK